MSRKKNRKRSKAGARSRSGAAKPPRASTGLPARADGTPTLTVSMIARDEAELLPACLASIADLADEIVLVDTGSADATIEIARRHGARIGHFEWVDDFAAARNASSAMARGDWVLSLDADEEIDAADHARIRRLIAADRADAFQMTTRNYCQRVTAPNFRPDDGSYPGRCLSEPGWVPSIKIRLWRNHLGLEWRRPVHELIEGSAQELGARMLSTAVPIHHYGLTQRSAAKQEHYFQLGLRAIEENPLDSGAHLEVGLLSVHRGEIEKALEHLARAAELSPRPANPLVQMAGVLLTEMRFDEARERLETALELEPDNGEVLHAFGVLEHFGAGDSTKAISYLRRSLEVNPDYALAHFNLARCRRALGQSDEALIEIRRATELAPRHLPVLEMHAGIALELGRPEDALSVLDRSLEVDPEHWKTHNNRGIALFRLGSFTEAEAALDRAEELQPDSPEVRRNLAELARLRDGGAAFEGCPGARRPGISLCMIVKNEEDNLGRCLESAAPAFDQIVVVDTGSSDSTREIAAAHGAEIHHFEWCDDFAAARNRSLSFAECEWVMWLDADDAFPAESVARLRELVDSGRAPAGLQITLLMAQSGAFRQRVRQLRIFPNRPGIHFEGVIHEQVVRSLEAAAIGVEQAAAIVVEHLGYSDAGEVRRKSERNLALLRTAAEGLGATYVDRYNLVQGCFGAGRASEAEASLGALLDDRRCRAERLDIWSHASVLRGRLRQGRGEHMEALADFDRAAEADPQSVLAAYFQATAHKALGDSRAARAALLRATVEPGAAPAIATAAERVRYQALMELAGIHVAEVDLGQARELLQRAIALAPAHPEAPILLARVDARAGLTEQAARLLESTLELAGPLPELLLPLGNLYFERRDLRRAESIYARAAPPTPRISANLGKVLVLQGRDDEAIPHLEEALEGAPELGDLHGVLGDAYLRRDRPGEALEHYETALRSGQPRSATTLAKISQAYARLGHDESARLAHSAALRLREGGAPAGSAPVDPSPARLP